MTPPFAAQPAPRAILSHRAMPIQAGGIARCSCARSDCSIVTAYPANCMGEGKRGEATALPFLAVLPRGKLVRTLGQVGRRVAGTACSNKRDAIAKSPLRRCPDSSRTSFADVPKQWGFGRAFLCDVHDHDTRSITFHRLKEGVHRLDSEGFGDGHRGRPSSRNAHIENRHGFLPPSPMPHETERHAPPTPTPMSEGDCLGQLPRGLCGFRRQRERAVLASQPVS